jgi:integrase
MVQLQLLTGCRPAEVCVLRPVDLDRREQRCWVFRPGSDQGPHGVHKTAHHGHERIILLGPKAQEVVRPYLDVEPEAYCFNPARSEVQRHALRRAGRKRAVRQGRKGGPPTRRRRRAPTGRYDTHSYRRAIARACKKAGLPVWSPNQLRHTRATELRRHGLDLAKTILGHTKVETTLIYAEKDLSAAMDLMAEIG